MVMVVVGIEQEGVRSQACNAGGAGLPYELLSGLHPYPLPPLLLLLRPVLQTATTRASATATVLAVVLGND